MRINKPGLLSPVLLVMLALHGTSALAAKPSEPPGKTQQQHQPDKTKKQHSAKVDARGGQPRLDATANRAGFTAGNVRRDDGRDDRNDRRYDDRHWDRDGRNDHDWDRDRHDWDRDHRDWDRDDHKRFYSYSRDYDRRPYYDRRAVDRYYYYYPKRGYVVPRLPYGYRVVRYSGVPYYFGGGSWYRPYGSSFAVVAPPIGLMLSFLPDVYTTLFAGGVPYYYANDVYYRWRPEQRAYIVTALPPGHY